MRVAFLGFVVVGAAVDGAVFFGRALAGALLVLAATAARFFRAPSVVDPTASALVTRAVALMKVLLAASAAFRALRAALLAFL